MKRIYATLVITLVPVAGMAHGAHPPVADVAHGFAHTAPLAGVGAIILAGIVAHAKRRARS